MMTPKEEALLHTQLRQHIGRTVNTKDPRFPGIRVESGKTIFTDGAILCVYDYVLPEIPKDGFYNMPVKGAFVFGSEVGPDVGILCSWRSIVPQEDVYTEEVEFDRTDHGISYLLAHLGSQGITVNLRYILNLPQGLYTVRYRPAGEGGWRIIPIALRRQIVGGGEFAAYLMPLRPVDPGVRRITSEQMPGAETKPDDEQNTGGEEHG